MSSGRRGAQKGDDKVVHTIEGVLSICVAFLLRKHHGSGAWGLTLGSGRAMAAQEAQEAGAALKLPEFSGLEADWTEWSFILRACASAKLEHGEALLAAAHQENRDVSLEAMERRNPAAAQEARKLFFMLVMTVKGPAQAILRAVEPNNGAEAWQALHRRYEPATAMRAQSITQGALSVLVFPGTLAEFEEKHGEWLADIRRYEAASGEQFNEGVKKTIFLQKAPRAIRTLLHMQSNRSYAELVATVVQYLQAATPGPRRTSKAANSHPGTQTPWRSMPSPARAARARTTRAARAKAKAKERTAARRRAARPRAARASTRRGRALHRAASSVARTTGRETAH